MTFPSSTDVERALSAGPVVRRDDASSSLFHRPTVSSIDRANERPRLSLSLFIFLSFILAHIPETYVLLFAGDVARDRDLRKREVRDARKVSSSRSPKDANEPRLTPSELCASPFVNLEVDGVRDTCQSAIYIDISLRPHLRPYGRINFALSNAAAVDKRRVY